MTTPVSFPTLIIPAIPKPTMPLWLKAIYWLSTMLGWLSTMLGIGGRVSDVQLSYGFVKRHQFALRRMEADVSEASWQIEKEISIPLIDAFMQALIEAKEIDFLDGMAESAYQYCVRTGHILNPDSTDKMPMPTNPEKHAAGFAYAEKFIQEQEALKQNTVRNEFTWALSCYAKTRRIPGTAAKPWVKARRLE